MDQFTYRQLNNFYGIFRHYSFPVKMPESEICRGEVKLTIGSEEFTSVLVCPTVMSSLNSNDIALE
jgi:hypothetical protein